MNIQTITSYALSVSSDTKYAAFSADAIAKAIEVTLLGMCMVFAVLALLWLALAVFKVVFAKDSSKAKKTVKEVSIPEAVVAPTVEKVTDDAELVAVITAAIAAYRSSEEGIVGEAASGFRVVSFKRAAKGRAWNSNK